MAEKWTGLVRNDLRLDTSDKNSFLPPGPAANAAVAGCRINGRTAKIVRREKDLGVDTVATGTRVDTVLTERTANATHRASKNAFVPHTMVSSGAGIQYVRKAQMLARQSLQPAQTYGNSAIGASPSITSRQKSNMANASGVMCKGTSRTLAIQWTFGPDASRTSLTLSLSSMHG